METFKKRVSRFKISFTWMKLRGSADRGKAWSAIVRAYTNPSYAACVASIFSSKPFNILRHMNSLFEKQNASWLKRLASGEEKTKTDESLPNPFSIGTILVRIQLGDKLHGFGHFSHQRIYKGLLLFDGLSISQVRIPKELKDWSLKVWNNKMLRIRSRSVNWRHIHK